MTSTGTTDEWTVVWVTMDECTSKTSKESSEIKLSTSCYSCSWIIHSFSNAVCSSLVLV